MVHTGQSAVTPLDLSKVPPPETAQFVKKI